MVRFMASEIAEIVGGTVVGPDVEVDGASIDSRSIAAGNLFVPIVAERDGHDFIEGATTAGAAAHLSSRPATSHPATATAIVVDDTATALATLGSAARDRLGTAHVVGVTGSVGKTSTKDLIAAAVGAALRVHANEASFNNELGLPLTLLNAPDGTELTVLEMGARGQGHIAHLCSIGRPTIGVVTRVAGAHTELFGSLDGVQQAKGELIESLPRDGTAVLNADDERVMAMASRTSADVITFGLAGDVRPEDLRLDEALRPTFTLNTPAGSAEVRLPIAGAHMAINATAAVAVGLAAGVSLVDLVAGLEGASLSNWRMAVSRSEAGATIINDAYNANPTSVRAALAALRELDCTRRIAVLGVMAELGNEHEAEHRAIADEANAAGIEVIAVDAPAYGSSAIHVSAIPGALMAIGAVDSHTGVLVKGSRVAGLERLAAILTAGGVHE